MEEELHHIYSGASETARLQMTTAPMMKQEKAALDRAKTFLAEAGLSDWVAEQDVEKGIAPMSGVVFDHMRRTNLRPSVKRERE